MTNTEHRVSKLEDKYHTVDKRQESFETFTKAQMERLEQKQDSFETFVRGYIEGNEKHFERMDAKIDALSNQMHNLIITGAIGIAAIVVAIALK